MPDESQRAKSWCKYTVLGPATGIPWGALFDECVIRGRRFAPARFCAPLVGYTHSAFRRLVAELGGCGAVWTEMLAARQILSENSRTSPWLRRRSGEGCVFYQLMLGPGDPLERMWIGWERRGRRRWT